MGAEDTARHVTKNTPFCTECSGVLKIELWILEPRDVALLHVCPTHGVAAISRPFR